MTARTATLLAAVGLMSIAAPAMAQDHAVLAHPSSAAEAAADAAEAAAADATAEGMRHGMGQPATSHPSMSHPAMDHPPMDHSPIAQPPMAQPQMAHPQMVPAAMDSRQMTGAPRLGYSPQQRDAWLAECHANHAPRERRQGGLLGGFLGAVLGGVAGNRIADGARLGGTLLGAGVGGLAGAAVGTAIDRADERRDARREDAALAYCEDYLGRYESGAYAQPGYGYGMMAVPVMMVPVAMQQARPHVHGPECEEIEEWDEVVAPVGYTRPRARAQAPAPRPGKLVPVRVAPVRQGKLLPAK